MYAPVSGLSLRLAIAFAGVILGRSLYRAYKIRSRFKKLKAQGIPLLPHSWLLGHLRILFAFRRAFPSDINIGNFHVWLVQNFSLYFPSHQHVPPVIYLDLWPMLPAPIVAAYAPFTAAQFTSVRSLDKHAISLDFMAPLTKRLDLSTLQGDAWRKWRAWFNPGFGHRNVAAMVPELLDEIAVFRDKLVARAGSGPGGGEWGQVFQLRDMTTALTFDIIARAVLDKRLREQDNPDPAGSPLRRALADQLRLMGRGQAFSLAAKMPWHSLAVARNNQVVHDVLIRDMERSIAESSLLSAHAKDKDTKKETATPTKKTVLGLALHHLAAETGRVPSAHDTAMVDAIMGNLKAFLVAGHETTASALCFVVKALADHPSILARVRAEHDAVLGPDHAEAEAVLRAAPARLSELRYTHAVVKEALRLYQLASTMRGGEPGFDLVVAGAGCGCEACRACPPCPTEGFLVWDGAAGIQRDPRLWPRADEFLPDRWLVGHEDPLHPVKDAWRAMGRGPRDCVGQEIAWVEIKLTLALLVRTFDIEEAWEDWDKLRGTKGKKDMVNGQRLYVAGHGIGHPKDGMPVHVRLRPVQKAALT